MNKVKLLLKLSGIVLTFTILHTSCDGRSDNQSHAPTNQDEQSFGGSPNAGSHSHSLADSTDISTPSPDSVGGTTSTTAGAQTGNDNNTTSGRSQSTSGSTTSGNTTSGGINSGSTSGTTSGSNK